ncbi:NAD(P)/FAD-dependent oxidoreductase [Flavobacterium sp. CS20]|uniref:NAD(P)/FAD-dependent oxidoreductase n=1 Tax=Flavobacterium sp. CS20 TaxID=2775246 RepID=UPI001B3A5FEC|nr:NAD(P)/FAD-dependent oxidoreductase [Flavobacterium sp. CS20]QTY27238.1 NAD(P)/FAD-dependent oxidoreductase [Flavobacterium sp. CS20]
MIETFDVIVVGGGPAGGQTARNLSKLGHKVLLTERYESFADNNFSSAGMTLVPLDEFKIPQSVIGSYWKNLKIQCTKDEYAWTSDQNKGVVLDFGKLRQFLADEVKVNGGKVLMGHRYVKKKVIQDGIIIDFVNSANQKTVQYKAKLVVDATGPVRKVMYNNKDDQPQMVLGSGLEYLIKVDQETYNKYKDNLIFFLGHKWALQGYSWIFPMENKILKVGAGKVHIKAKDQDKTNKTTKKLTEKVIDEYIKPIDYEILDVHGGTLKYSPSIKDTFYKDRVVAVGDAISTVNPLGGEGIRYAMQSANLACEYIDSFLKTNQNTFDKYRKAWRKKNLLKWQICELSSKRVYIKYTDEQIENRMKFYHDNASYDEFLNMLFHFKFRKIGLRIIQVFKTKLSYKLSGKTF